ncbi:hypothetical protein [Arthrobacter sp. zg-Y877]|uniref:hypothetical protein n=1 Tax=Arthrobacter sp. zg-Y877 TaxID=3049074 RepID=UPI0025A495A2|nr:hypothetical protein [Arthrobacter sp. zg-Y877]MDM7990716.1 hypothetical protein [Arthrobacter sp. zg-Y877]
MQLTKKDVVVIALDSLGGATALIDTEDIAIAAHGRAPNAFGWRKHTEHIDLDTVRTSLRHEKESTQPRLDGSIREGWHLTPVGQTWIATQARELLGKIEVATTSPKSAARRAETHEVAATMDRLRSSHAFTAWASGVPVQARDAAAAFRIDSYTPKRDRILKTAKVRELARDHPELHNFLDQIIPVALQFDNQAPRKPKS